MLKDKDRIFQNLYNDLGPDLNSSQKRGDWVNTKELTDKGRALSPSLIALMQWGDQWCSSEEPLVKLVHDDCGSLLTHSVKCNTCGTDVKANEIRSLVRSDHNKINIGISNAN